jgi:general stress protein 26
MEGSRWEAELGVPIAHWRLGGTAVGQPSLDRVWDIVEKVGVCMLTTRYAEGLRARPLEARPDRDAGLIWFVTDVRGAKDDEIAAHDAACLIFIDHRDKAYLSIAGRADVRNDHAKARAIWRKTDGAWWSGPDDPNVRVLRFAPARAELWDGPASSAVAAFAFAKARLTGEKPNLGENRKVTVEM